MKKQVLVNIIASMVAFIVQMVISFGLTPILVNSLGEEAYGFIGLANNFVTYATVLTVAINSIASRFVSVEYNRGNIEKANIYYSSLFIANAVLSLLILIASTFITINLHHIINIPQVITFDVKLTFFIVFINFVFSLFHTTFQVVPFVKNKISLVSITTAVSNIVKIVIVIALFALFVPRIYYIAISILAYSVVLLILCIIISNKLSKDIKVDVKKFSFSYIKTLIASGFWNTINNLSRILLTGMDLLIANIFVDGYSMGLLSIAKNIPNAIETLLATLALAFVPSITILYAKDKVGDVISEVKLSIKVIALIMIVPIAGFVAFGSSFYSIWLGKSIDEVSKIQLLSVLTLIPYMFSVCSYSLPNIDTVTNKLKRASIFTLIISIVTVVTEIFVLKVTDLGVMAIAGVSSFYWVIKVVIFNPLNAARNLNVKWYTFYGTFLKSLFCLVILLCMYFLINSFVAITSWIQLISIGIVLGIIGYLVSFIIILSNDERKIILNKILRLNKNEV